MPVGGITVPETFTTALSAQASSLVSSLGGWIPVIIVATIAVPVIVSFFRFIQKTVRGGLRVR